MPEANSAFFALIFLNLSSIFFLQNLLKTSFCIKVTPDLAVSVYGGGDGALIIHPLNLQPHSVTGLGTWDRVQMLGCVAKLRHFNKFACED